MYMIDGLYIAHCYITISLVLTKQTRKMTIELFIVEHLKWYEGPSEF
jgi:hypothetical protein